MDEHALRILEYDKVIEIVAGYAASAPAKAALGGIRPSADVRTVKARLGETDEFMRLLSAEERPSLDGIRDIGPALERLRAEGIALSYQEIFEIAATLAVSRRVKGFFRKYEAGGEGASAPLLCGIASRISPLREIEDRVFEAIDEKDGVKDSASPDLRKIRRQIARTREDILSRMTRIIRDGEKRDIVQEPVITIRDGRYVLPLKPNFRQAFRGVVHGQSVSHATLFVEPLDVLEMNNRLAELRIEEQDEVERILRRLTALLHEKADAVRASFQAVAEIDAVCAKARFGIEYRGVVPQITSSGVVRLRGARHPLLVWKRRSDPAGHDVVQNDVDIGEASSVLIISGPNAGGKTVLLKTIGVLCLMTQSGLPVTASEGSALPVFGAVFADIGDEQSIEQDMSTFSSHVRRIAEIVNISVKDSLVLLDELGTGTDPSEGAALGRAVLSSLIEKGCVCVATTHHGALKIFGARTAGAVNAAMEFDPDTLKPTYRFLPGLPGRSYGLDMAGRLGMPESVTQRARELLGEQETGMDGLLRQIEIDSRRLSALRDQTEKELSAAQARREEAESLLRAAREEAKNIRSTAKEESREVIAALRKKLRDIMEASALDRAAIKRETIEVDDLARRLKQNEVERDRTPSEAHEYRRGERVRVRKLDKTGVVISSHKGVIEIDVNGKTVKLSEHEVASVGGGPSSGPVSSVPGWGAELHEPEGMPDRLNIIGSRVPEAMAEVEKFVDRAFLSGLSSVTIIHGIGAGALKAAVSGSLRSHPLIAGMRPGGPAEGGAGVTVAELKK